jgi:hypothetical protein
MQEAEQENTPRVPHHLEPVLESVLKGETEPATVQVGFGLSQYELGILLRALIRQRAREFQWFTD